jgi:hypothetical protein
MLKKINIKISDKTLEEMQELEMLLADAESLNLNLKKFGLELSINRTCQEPLNKIFSNFD